MKEGQTLYFTQAELEILMELSGGPAHTVYRTGSPPDDAALRQALASLYRRGFLNRLPTTFALSDAAAFCKEMCLAPLSVVLTARYPRQTAAVCYANDETVWLAECVRTVLSEGIRLNRLSLREFGEWLYDSEILIPSALTREDTDGLSPFEDGEEDDENKVRLRLEKYQNGGALLSCYEVLDDCGMSWLRVREDGREEMEPCTVDALPSMLERCFGKGRYDYCEH